MTDYSVLKRGVFAGMFAGLLWGPFAVAVNALSGVFQFEHGIVYNLISFAIGGCVFGAVAGGFLSLIYGQLPFKSPFKKAALLTTCMWLALRIGGFILSLINEGRYHEMTAQTAQGFALAVAMGLFIGAIWQLQEKRISSCQP